MTTATSELLKPGKAVFNRAAAAALAVGMFFYGDEERTKRSLTFAYGCILLYMISYINFGHISAGLCG